MSETTPADPHVGIHVTHRDLLGRVLDRWSLAVLDRLCERPARFNVLRREIPGVTQKSLSATLRRLERDGIVRRRVIDARPVGVEYSITPLGKTLRDPIDALVRWVETHGPAVERNRAAFDDERDTTG